MHPYTTDEAKPTTLGAIAVVAVIVSWALTWAAQPLPFPEWLVSAPSLAGSYASIYAIFDRHLWRSAWSRRLGLATVPNVAGTYRGTLTSAYPPGDKTTVPVCLTITQTWTRIEVAMEVEGRTTSRSTSFMASVRATGTATRISYSYRNQALPTVADADMGDHEGTADLLIDGDGKAVGPYYNNRPRVGTLQLVRT